MVGKVQSIYILIACTVVAAKNLSVDSINKEPASFKKSNLKPSKLLKKLPYWNIQEKLRRNNDKETNHLSFHNTSGLTKFTDKSGPSFHEQKEKEEQSKDDYGKGGAEKSYVLVKESARDATRNSQNYEETRNTKSKKLNGKEHENVGDLRYLDRSDNEEKDLKESSKNTDEENSYSNQGASFNYNEQNKEGDLKDPFKYNDDEQNDQRYIDIDWASQNVPANDHFNSDKKSVENDIIEVRSNQGSQEDNERLKNPVNKDEDGDPSVAKKFAVNEEEMMNDETDWKFHFKKREDEVPHEGEYAGQEESFQVVKRDAPGDESDASNDWSSHAHNIGGMLDKAAASSGNDTVESGNQTGVNRSQLAEDGIAKQHPPTTEKVEEEKQPELPPKGAAEEEHHSSLTIFFILLVVAISILVVHFLIQTKFHYLPDSIAIVLIGAFIGLLLKLFKFGNWKNEEAFPPTVFFIVLLPPIIFEGGYNLHKGNFFHNIGSIMVFAVVGTVISAMIVGGGVYLLGQAEVVYQFDLVESFAFGSLISAVDPVATLAIFQALDVDPILYMLVFGESMLNDAVSIVLTTTLLEFASPTAVVMSGAAAFFQAVARFSFMFFGSAAIGVLFGLLSAVMTKFFDFHKTPSLEVGMVFAFSYLPYALAEGIHLSGIMAILFCGIVMSHYTHLNLSPISQITVQQTFRTIAFIAETCVFAYLGLAIFSFKVNVKPAFTIWSIILILVGRAANIFPLSFLMNFFREHKITQKNQFIMWFSGLRGAVAFALSLHMGLENQEKQYVLVTTTLILVLFTIVFLGGSTMPILKFLQTSDKKYKKKKKYDSEVSMSKTKEMGDAIDSEHLSELTEEDESHVIRHHVKGFLKLDARYLIPFFTKRFTQQEMREGRSQVDLLAKQWQMEVRAAPSETDGEDDSNTEMMAETSLMGNGGNNGTNANTNGRPSWD